MSQDAEYELIPRLRGVSHAAAFLLAVAAAIVLLALADGTRATIAVIVNGVGLVALFGGSALYHRWPGPRRSKPLLRRIDHSTIFVFIAASYTPVALIVLDGAVAWVLLVGAWAGAVAGVTFSLGWIDASATATTSSPRSPATGAAPPSTARTSLAFSSRRRMSWSCWARTASSPTSPSTSTASRWSG